MIVGEEVVSVGWVGDGRCLCGDGIPRKLMNFSSGAVTSRNLLARLKAGQVFHCFDNKRPVPVDNRDCAASDITKVDRYCFN